MSRSRAPALKRSASSSAASRSTAASPLVGLAAAAASAARRRNATVKQEHHDEGGAGILAHASPFHTGVTLFTIKPEPEEGDDEVMMTMHESQAHVEDVGGLKRLRIEESDDAENADVDSGVRRSGRRTRRKMASGEGEDEDASEAVVRVLPRRGTRMRLEGEEARVKDEVIQDTKLEFEVETTGSKGKQKQKQKQKPIKLELDVPHPAPENWRETYDTIKDMRRKIVAPVDTMGCATAQWQETDPKNKRFVTLVSLMLSSQTKDEVTDAALKKLRVALGGTISLDNILKADENTISGAINKVGFWRRKTGYLKQTAQKLRDEFGSDVPKTVDELCSLPGVGPKMSFLVLQVAWNLNVGIGVDIHVHRITNRLGWHQKPTKTPEETRLNLQSWLPPDLRHDINHMLVGFGQVICLPVGPKCGECELSTKGLCPSATFKTGSKSKAKAKSKAPLAEPKVEIELEET